MNLQGGIELANQLVQLLGVPVAVAVFILAKRRERIDRQKGTFTSLGDRYTSFLRLCLEHTDLPLFGANYAPDVLHGLDKTQRLRTEIIFCELIGLLESSFLLYDEHRGSRMHQDQWEGWEAYAREYFDNPAFRALWPELSRQFDAGFQRTMNGLAPHASAAAQG